MNDIQRAVAHVRVLLAAATLTGAAPFASAQPSDVWHASQWHLWRIEVDGAGLMPLDQTANTRCGSPVWSPDGKQIVYDVLGESGGYQIAVINSDGTNRRILGRGSIPCWSPDGKLILCQGGGKNIMNADGAGRETFPGPAFGLRWSPRGNRIASMAGPGFSIMNLRTGKEHPILTGDRVEHGFDFSSDGSQICYGANRGGLCVATLDPQTRIATVARVVQSGAAYHASWSPDDRRIVFAWQRWPPTDLIQLYIYDMEAGGSPQLVPGLDISHHNVNPEWSPDGKTIVFSLPEPWN